MHYIPLSCTSPPCNVLFLDPGVYGVVQATVGVGTVLIWALLRSVSRGGDYYQTFTEGPLSVGISALVGLPLRPPPPTPHTCILRIPLPQQLLGRPTYIMEGEQGGEITYKNVQVNERLDLLVFVRRQDQSKYDAHCRDPVHNPYKLSKVVVSIVDIVDFETDSDRIPQKHRRSFDSRPDTKNKIAKIEYTDVKTRTPGYRVFAFFDEPAFQVL